MERAAEVTLQEILLNRERRVLRQRAAIEAFGRPLISITLVTPGPVKDSPTSRRVMHHALRTLETLMASRGWQILNREEFLDPTGPEALLVVAASSRELKAATAHLEDEHPLGRLWDIDVIDTLGTACSRSTLGLPARRCLLCQEDAHLCVRSRAHPLPELQQAVQEIVHAYRDF